MSSSDGRADQSAMCRPQPTTTTARHTTNSASFPSSTFFLMCTSTAFKACNARGKCRQLTTERPRKAPSSSIGSPPPSINAATAQCQLAPTLSRDVHLVCVRHPAPQTLQWALNQTFCVDEQTCQRGTAATFVASGDYTFALDNGQISVSFLTGLFEAHDESSDIIDS